MMKHEPKKRGRPFLRTGEGRLKVRTARLDQDTIRRLKRLGHGNLSEGIRKAAASRSTKRYRLMVEAARAVIDRYDMDEDMAPAIDDLVDAIQLRESAH